MSTRRRGAVSAFFGIIVVAIVAGVLVAVGVTPAVAITGAAAGDGIGLFENLPSDLKQSPLDQRTAIYANEGANSDKKVLIARFYSQNRKSIPWSDVSTAVKDATLAAEDHSYYQHGAVDPTGMLRAVIADAAGGSIQGASTLTQQYVKNVCVQNAEKLGSAKAVQAAYQECTATDVGRKLQEARYAIGLEQKYSKNQILLGYLNIAGFGGNVYGIQAAAQYYYDVDAKNLSIAQAASLLAIVNDPADLRIDEKANIPADTNRRNYVLASELKYKMITKAQYDTAIATKVSPKITPLKTGCDQAGVAGYFCSYVVSLIEQDPTFGKTASERYDNLYDDGWQIDTTLNLDLEKKAQDVMNAYVPKTSTAFDIGGAAVSVGVGTGAITTMVENKNYNDTGDADLGAAYQAVNYNVDETDGGAGGIQPGSTYKLFTLIDWLENGHTLDETVNGDQRTIPGSDFTACGKTYTGSAWSVADDEGAADDGPTTVTRATALSINGAFASMGEQLDLCDIRSTAEKFDVHAANGGTLNDYPASIIGTNYVAPLTMATAYAAMGDGGIVCTPVAIISVTTSSGSSLPVPKTSCTQAAPKDVVIAADQALRAVFEDGTAAGDSTPDGVYEVGKTGTTDGNANTWTIGTSNKIATAVWIGNVEGYTDLRTIYSTPYCALDGSSQAAIERHCVWRGIQTLEDQYYGGSSQSFGTPLAKYVTGDTIDPYSSGTTGTSGGTSTGGSTSTGSTSPGGSPGSTSATPTPTPSATPEPSSTAPGTTG